MNGFSILVLVLGCFGTIRAQISPCSPTMRSAFPNGCIAYMMQAMSDPNLYWFGSLFEPLCQTKSNRFSECVSFRVNTTLRIPTLGARLFAPTPFNPYTSLSTLRAIPAVVYNATAGQFSGCNSTQQLLNDMYFEVYPGMSPVTPYMVKDAPRVIAPGCSTTQLCTLMLYDGGIGVLHNIWADWDGTAPLTNYVGPGIGLRNPNPYIWIYYYQNGNTTIGATRGFTFNVFTFNLVDFQRQYNLTGPIGITWLDVVTDVYGEQFLRDNGIMQNCPSLLDGALRADPNIFPVLGMGPIPELDAWMGIMFIDGTTTVWADPLANGVVAQSATTNQPQIIMDPRRAQPNVATDLPGQYLLLLVEPSNSYYVIYGRQPLIVHWLVTNNPITRSVVPLIGDVTIPYTASAMATSGVATGAMQNYALMFKQNGGTLDQQTLTAWFNQRGCSAATNYTCSFAVQDLMNTANIALTAVSRWRVI